MSWLPSWVGSLVAAVWVRGPDGRIRYLNGHAESLLGRSTAACIGKRCHEVVAGRDESGRPFCEASCSLVQRARRGRDLAPALLRLGPAGAEPRWIQVLAIPIRAPDGSGPWLVHCALAADRAHRLGSFLNRVASRSPHAATPGGVAQLLSGRELEILRLLADDENLHAIAARLQVRHVTVRNHVQHILTKLGAHSILEAVAIYLVTQDEKS